MGHVKIFRKGHPKINPPLLLLLSMWVCHTKFKISHMVFLNLLFF